MLPNLSKKTKADRFFYKPFDIEELIASIKERVGPFLGEPKKLTLQDLLSKIQFSDEELQEAINHMDQISGFDISFCLPALMLSESTGHLNISDAEKRKCILTLVGGKIREVGSESAFQTINQLLIKQGLLTQDECNEVLEKSEKSDFEKSLIDNNWVSPHAMTILKKEQISLELEKIITPGSIKATFIPEKKDSPSPCDIDYESIQPSFHEIIEFQIDSHWLHRFYSPCMDCAIVLKPEVGINHPIFSHPMTKKIEDLFEVLSKSPVLKDLLGRSQESAKEILYRALHILTTNQLIVFVGQESQKASADTDKERTFSRLNILFDKIKDLNPIEIFQFLGASKNAQVKEIEEIFKTFSRSNHPDKLPKNASNQLRDLNLKIFSMILEAYGIMTDDSKKRSYRSSMRQKKAELQLKSQTLVERGVVSLRQGQFRQAIEELKTAYQYYESQQTLLYLYWAELKMFRDKLPPEKSKAINDSLIAFPTDYKKSEIYYLVYGLLKREGGNLRESGEAFRKSLQINPSFLDAKRELMSLLKEDKKRNQNIFTGDLSSVVSGFFKKKS